MSCRPVEERERVLAAIDEKVSGGKVVASGHPEDAVIGGGQVIDLMATLQASLGRGRAAAKSAKAPAPSRPNNVTPMAEAKQRKTAKRTPKTPEPAAAAPAPATRSRKK
jgi:DNA end-binding protein Ku